MEVQFLQEARSYCIFVYVCKNISFFTFFYVHTEKKYQRCSDTTTNKTY